jgi:hypothetical protein
MWSIAGIGFIHAVGRSFVPKGIIPSMNTVMTLAYHKVPHLWRFVSHFPQAASGKPQKFILRERGLKGWCAPGCCLRRTVKALKRHRQASTPAGWS